MRSIRAGALLPALRRLPSNEFDPVGVAVRAAALCTAVRRLHVTTPTRLTAEPPSGGTTAATAEPTMTATVGASPSPLPAGAPPPPRRVRRYYIPGLEEVGAGVTPRGSSGGEHSALLKKPMPAHTAAKPTPATTTTAVPKGSGTGGAKDRPSRMAEGTAVASPTSVTPTPPATPTSPVSPEALSPSPPASSSTPAGDVAAGTVAAGTAAVKKSPSDVDDASDPRVLVPSALVRETQERNAKIKTVLMAALGSDFAKAGMQSDGVRTSFSVVSYQTVKQRTGLKSIPAKLLVSCLTSPDGTVDWIDISAHPTATLTEYKEAIQEVLVSLGMHASMVDDSTEPMLLPQVTITKECLSLLLRYAIDTQGSKRMDSFQDLTNRFTLFVTKERVITVHRTQCNYVEELKKNWQTMLEEQEGHVARFLMYYFVKETVQTFMRAIAKCLVEFDRYEAGLFAATRARASLAREIYHIKRRAAVYARTLTMTKDAYTHMAGAMNVYSSNVSYQEVLHDLAHMESLAEELNANADSVLQLLFQLSSYQVNELMRVLTLFSAFFIPISFIAAVYGMNFENLPFMHDEYGEVYCGLLMLSVATFIYLWFKANHFI